MIKVNEKDRAKLEGSMKSGRRRKTPSPSCRRQIFYKRLALPKPFAYKDLVAATNGFANDRRLGQGRSGQVYNGFIQDLGQVCCQENFVQSEHYEKIFINEVKIISRLIHRNLVQFIGWCHEC
ncbi:unnamed protein product [Prunus armeniaca]|uniref:Protein kinase domain-containing protein n=1 Tax=Prunus armeniaca TaxID=36596 RepID=A0A6J5UQ17_PRUAR|nr:unnamed protein product [Prunus armeniaca]